MASMFQSAIFNGNISGWDTSNVKNMASMFRYNSAFNQSIGIWNVNSVTDMSYMFHGTIFNEIISGWVTSKVKYMNGMFESAKFNQPIGNWDV